MSGLIHWRLISSAHHTSVMFSLLLLSRHVHIAPNDRFGLDPYYPDGDPVEVDECQSGGSWIDHFRKLVDGEQVGDDGRRYLPGIDSHHPSDHSA